MIRSTELALGSRLKILSERLYAQGDQIYRDNNINFQARWFPIVYILYKKGAVSVTSMANELGLTHSAVSQMSRKIIKNGIIELRIDKQDERRRLLTLTKDGKELCEQLEPLWNDILVAVQELLKRAGIDMMATLARFERELDKQDLVALVRERTKARQSQAVEIVEYTPQYKEAFKTLNVEWLEKYFYVEKIDDDILSDPERHILQTGGYIFFAKYDNEIVGTSALIKHEDAGFELSKMAVTEKYQGLHIGRKLAEAAIEKVKSLGAKQLFLETNSKLTPALNLYKKLGFKQTDYPKGKSEHYQRSGPYMVLKFGLTENPITHAPNSSPA